ncbi:MAG: MBL fold metallo-hydrolase [Candidatus Aminicenantes bacterium]|nr:MBL fold metallo-hydrolase [Candidatus Aminicenantes bacterium]
MTIVAAAAVVLFLNIPPAASRHGSNQDGDEQSATTKVVLLGTGNPNPDPRHSGCSVLILVGDASYIIDCGPGLIRRAAALTPKYGGPIPGFDIQNITKAFFTHLHSDHTIGYPDLILTPWVLGRNEPLEVYGPEGMLEMTDHILKAYREDIAYRIYGSEPANNAGWKVHVHEIEEGLVYRDGLVRVESFAVKHGTWPRAFGYRFKTPDKTIVISGDTRPCENIVKYAAGADILVHEVYSQKGFESRPQEWKAYHAEHHTSTLELAGLAERAKPKLLVLYHTLYWGSTDEEILAEIASKYKGKVEAGKDLKIYE